MSILTGHTFEQLPFSVEAKGSSLYFRSSNVGMMMMPIGPIYVAPELSPPLLRYTGQVFMHAAQRMHFRECQNRCIPKRADLPLSTRMTCMAAPLRGPRNIEVYCVIASPVALRASKRMKTAMHSVVGMILSMPTEHMCSWGVFAERSAFPSLVATTMAP